MKFYSKPIMGLSYEVPGEVDSSWNMTYDKSTVEVRMPIEECKKLIEQLKEAKDRAARAEHDKVIEKNECVKDKASYKKNIDAENEKIKKEADERVAKAEHHIEEMASQFEAERVGLEVRIDNEKELNRNLLRIMRERANAERGLCPKKGHDGYIVLNSRQWKERFKVDVWDTPGLERVYADDHKEAIRKGYLRVEQRIGTAWKSVIQTPYDASLALATIEPYIEDSLIEDGILGDLGVLNVNYSGVPYDECSENMLNTLYKHVYVANFRTGFWEMEVYTTQCLKVSNQRRPQKNGKSHMASIESSVPIDEEGASLVSDYT